jgi:ribosomal protein S18 acetylase RimI-like enzyme
MGITVRRAEADDIEHIKRALYEALAWQGPDSIPPIEWVLAHPEAARYHEGWGRVGDLAMIAEDGEEVVGASFCRLFTDEDHGEGYLDAVTPELGVAVWPADRRGRGIGTMLITALEQQALAAGIGQLSLSVEIENPSRRLYEHLGYQFVRLDPGGGHLMVKTLG